ncbi:unnamed protein product [Candidula unifasciata]|uniref:TIR domain-containing protein n=1 Tax=Candidula unifasciata TaxID=100452 RepID=A0A8S3YZ44_9EUPU|nr:unnamed protein product [Candidula unifasciata]
MAGPGTHLPEDTHSITQADTVVLHLQSTPRNPVKHSTFFQKHDELKTVFSGNVKHVSTNLPHRNKELSSPILHSLINNAAEFHQDVFPEGSKIHELTDFLQAKYRDEFRCPPCQCYYTFSGSLIASCNSSIHEINEDLSKETQQLTISNSSLKVFQATDFLQYHNLYNLSVTHNAALNMIANISEKIQMLTVTSLNLTSNKITQIMDRSFTMFSNLQSLSLQGNQVEIITTLTFEGLTNLEYLNLVRNRVSVLIKGAFDHLKNLKVLDLSRNCLNASFMPGVFSNLVYLQKLYINGDTVLTKRYPNEEIGRLTNLTFLSIDAISKHVILGPDIKNLTKLVTLHVGLSNPNHCQLGHIKESFLENVPYLQTLRFSKCPITTVDDNVYKNVRALKSLEFISTYPYDIFKALGGLSGLQNSSLISLKLINLIKSGCPFICLFGRHARYLSTIDLEIIDLSENRIAYIETGFINAFPRTLRTLALRGNELTEPALLTDKLHFLRNLETIDLGVYTDLVSSSGISQAQQLGKVSKMKASNKISQFDARDGSGQKQTLSRLAKTDDKNQKRSDTHKTKELWNRNLLEPQDGVNKRLLYALEIPEDAPDCRQQYSSTQYKDNVSISTFVFHSMESRLPSLDNNTALHTLLAPGFLEIDVFRLYRSIRANKHTNLAYIDLSYCALSSLSLKPSIPSSIQIAVFSGKYIRHMQRHTVHRDNTLIYLFLSNNLLGDRFSSTDSRIFQRMQKLIFLDISSNLIYELPTNLFRGLQNLKYLIMTSNRLRLLNTNFSNTPKLEYMDLRKNAITGISKSSRDELDAITANHPLYIELTSNPLSCTCEGLGMLSWILTSNIHFVSKDFLSCAGDNGITEDMGNIDDRVRSLQRQCVGNDLIIVVCVATLVVICFLVVFGVLYRYRWQLRYIRNIALSRFVGFQPQGNDSSEFRFDGFVVYSEMSRQFVVSDCLRELEVKRGHKLCVDDRDFLPGTYYLSAIVSAIQNSRKTLLILSPDFYDKRFSEYCVKMALMEEIYQKRSVLYLCVYRPLPDDEMSKSYDLLMIMNRNNYMEFPPETETSDEVRQHFWDQLSEKIGHSIASNLPESVE